MTPAFWELYVQLIPNALLSGESRYFRVSKQTTAQVGDGIGIGIGGVYLIELKDKDLARLMMLQN